MYWAVIRRALQNWPETHKFQPRDECHLHGWLLIEAGYYTAAEIDVADDEEKAAKAMARAIFSVTSREIHDMRLMRSGPGRWRVCVPDSLAYEAAGRAKYHEMRAAVYEIIVAALGIPSIEALKREKSDA
jgi:hypothetical protein